MTQTKYSININTRIVKIDISTNIHVYKLYYKRITLFI